MIIQVSKDANGSLKPADDEAAGVLSKISIGEVFNITIERIRNPRWHRMYWHLCTILLDASSGQYGHTKEQVSDSLKVLVGHVDGEGKPLSISFDNMEQSNFEAYYSRVSDMVATITGALPEHIQGMVEELTGQKLDRGE